MNENIEPECENILSIAGPRSTIQEIKNIVNEYQSSIEADDSNIADVAIFPALIPMPEGLDWSGRFKWCIQMWGTAGWPDSNDAPVHLLGDRETEEVSNHDDTMDDLATVEYSFITAAGPALKGAQNISARWPDTTVVIAWDDYTSRTLGAVRFNDGEPVGEHEMKGKGYPSIPRVPHSSSEFQEVLDEWMDQRMKALKISTEIAMGVKSIQSDDDTYERPVHATGVPSEDNYGEFIIAEVQNGKFSATIVTVPPTALSGSDHIEIFPTMSKYRVLAGVSTEWFDRLVCEATGWDYDSDDIPPEMSDEELDSNPRMQEAINKIMAESMVRIAVYFKAKGLTI